VQKQNFFVATKDSFYIPTPKAIPRARSGCVGRIPSFDSNLCAVLTKSNRCSFFINTNNRKIAVQNRHFTLLANYRLPSLKRPNIYISRNLQVFSHKVPSLLGRATFYRGISRGVKLEQYDPSFACVLFCPPASALILFARPQSDMIVFNANEGTTLVHYNHILPATHKTAIRKKILLV